MQDREIIISPMAFRAPRVAHVPHGLTMAEIVRQAGFDVPVVVEIDGEVIPRDRWNSVIPPINAHVLIYHHLHGDDPWRALLTIAVVVGASFVMGGGAALMTMGQALGAGGGYLMPGSFGAQLAGIGVMAAGMLLVNAIAPIRPPTLATGKQSYNDSPTYSLTDARNRANPWGAVPVNLGRNRVWPPLGAEPYTEIIGDDEYLRMLVVWGYGPLQVSNLKIGDTPLREFEGVTIEHREGLPGDSDITLIPSTVYQDGIGVVLTHGSPVVRAAPPNVDEISVDVICPGLVTFGADGARSLTEVEILVEYSDDDGVSYTDAPLTVDFHVAGETIPVKHSIYDPAYTTYSVYVSNPGGHIYAQKGTAAIDGSYRIAEYVITNQLNGAIGSLTNLSPAGVTGMSVTYSARQHLVEDTIMGGVHIVYTYHLHIAGGKAGTITAGSFLLQGQTPSAVRAGYRWDVDRTKSYLVRVSRVSADTDNDRIIDEVHWLNMRGIVDEPPIAFPYPLAMTALRIKASEQLQGSIDTLNGICESLVPIWDDTEEEWTTETYINNNPAALIRHVLTGDANALQRTATQINDADLGEFYEFCETHGYQYNTYRDFRTSVWDTCADIAATGRASPAIVDGVWTVTADTGDQPLVQHFTPRNSWGFSAEKNLIDAPHAFRVRFVNQEDDYAWEERVVYADGYTAANATRFEQLEFPGITDPSLIQRFGRYHIAQAALRPEVYSFFADFESLKCHRNSLIRVAHDVPMWGSGWGRVKALTLNGPETHITHIQLDEEIAMEAGESYACRFRLAADDSSLALSIVTDEGTTDTLELANPVEVALAPAVDDLAMFGKADTETTELLVHSIRRMGNFTAQIHCVDVAREIYNADTEPIPAFQPRMTRPVGITTQQPRPPEIRRMEAGESAVRVDAYGATSRIIVHLTQPGNVRVAKWRVRYRIARKVLGTTLTGGWLYAESDSLSVICDDVQDREAYQIQAQAVSPWGVVSDWGDTERVYVIGQSEPPADVEDFGINVIGGDAHLSWDAVPDRDLSHYRIRWTSEKDDPTWIGSADVVPQVARPATSVTVPVQIGSYLIKAVDYAGNESVNAAVIPPPIVRVAALNVVETIEQESPDWDGTGDGADYNTDLEGITLSEDLWPSENLITGWTNYGAAPFSTFTTDGATITSAIQGGTYAYGYTNTISFTEGRSYLLTITYAIISGSGFEIYTANNSDVTTAISTPDLTFVGGKTARATFVAGASDDILVIKASGTSITTVAFTLDLEPPLVAEGTFTFHSSETIDLGGVFTSRVTGEMDVTGSDVQDDIYQFEDIYDPGNLYESPEGKYSVSIEIRLTDDDTTGTPSWSAWKPLIVGDYSFRGLQARLKLTGTPPNITPIVTRAKVTIDMPDRTVSIDETIPIDGATVTYDRAFYATPSLGITITNGQSGDYFTISGADQDGFDIDCFISSHEGCYPQGYSGSYVRATTQKSGGFDPYRATDPSLGLTGTAVATSWSSQLNAVTNQRFHIDLGSAQVINKIYYENYHHGGGDTDIGAQNFTFWGSNVASAFAELTYATDTDWTQLTTNPTAFDEHAATDAADPKYITVTNTVSYRYYALKFADNHGDVSYMGLRHVELQSNRVARTITGIAKGYGEQE